MRCFVWTKSDGRCEREAHPGQVVCLQHLGSTQQVDLQQDVVCSDAEWRRRHARKYGRHRR